MSNGNFAEKTKATKEAKKIKEVAKVETEIMGEPEPVKITSNEIEVISSEFHNFRIALFEKDKPVFLTEKVLDMLFEMQNFKGLVDSGVIKIGL